MADGGSMTLGDVLAERSLGLEAVVMTPEMERRPVLGALPVEVPHPARFVREGWVMLTVGVSLRGRSDAQVALVDELQSAGVAALGFAVGPVFKRVPAALIKAAGRESMPLFAVPDAANFADIVRFVETALLSADTQVFRRLHHLERFLIDALGTPQPDRAIVERLSRFFDASVVLLDESGSVEMMSGKAPVEDFSAAVAARAPAPFEADVAGWHAVATPVSGSEADAPRWLIVASRYAAFATKLVRQAVITTAPLLAATHRLKEVIRTQEQAVRAALLQEALSADENHDPVALAARAASFGLDFAGPARVVVIRADPRRGAVSRGELDRAARELSHRLEQRATGYLLATDEEAVTALVQGTDAEFRDVLGELASRHPSIAIGLGRAVSELRAARHSLRDAEMAADRAAMQPGRHMLFFEEFDLGLFVTSEISPDRLRPWLGDLTAVLRENPPLHEALMTYFECDLDVAATADALHLHPNSVRYRLSRIEQLLGLTLRKPSTIASLYIALVADAATEEGGAARPQASTPTRIDERRASRMANRSGWSDGAVHPARAALRRS